MTKKPMPVNQNKFKSTILKSESCYNDPHNFFKIIKVYFAKLSDNLKTQ